MQLPTLAAVVVTITANLLIASGRCGEPTKPPLRNEQKGRFLRLVRDSQKQPVALEAAIVRFAAADQTRQKATVDLVSAVHVADKSYYRQLNREFDGYDAVLYELVAREGTQIPKGGRQGNDSTVSMLQNGLKNLLELEFQLDQIDYTRKNMVHADMSPDQFARSMRDRGESWFGMFAKMIGYTLARQEQASANTSEAQLLLALFDKNRALKFKQVMAEQFEEMEWMMGALDGPNGSTMISQRNKVALEVLRKQMALGKPKIAIFYGAGHMPDLQERLRSEFGLVPVKTRWLVAWDLKGASPAPKADGPAAKGASTE
jgi:hypothetical protein